MGSRTDVSEILTVARWSEEGFYLGEIAKTASFPCVVKVTRGQYQNIGQPSFSNPSLFSHLLLVSGGKQLGVAAQCVKFKNQRQRVVPFGPTLAIPSGFDGHFEILSEDGRSVPCIQSVEALLQTFPDSCLVREPIKGFRPLSPTATAPSTKDKAEIERILKDEVTACVLRLSDKSRVIGAGEVLVLLGEVCLPLGKNKVNRYLSCFDSKGQTVYLPLGQKGKFSPLAGEESISGVHTTKNILSKRMPLMVRLVDGKPPVPPLSKSNSFKFLPELRLFSTLEEELIFAMPLSQCWKECPAILPLPLSVPLKFQLCRNMGEVETMKEYCRTLEKVKALVSLSKDLIQIYDINLKKELRFDGRQWKAYAPPIFLSPEAPPPVNPNPSGYDIPDMQDYEDIDEIYDYVRGIKPTPASLRQKSGHHPVEKKLQSKAKAKLENQGNDYSLIPMTSAARPPPTEPIPIEDRPPEPPPIETIPSHRNRILLGLPPSKTNNNISTSGNNKERVNNMRNNRKPVIIPSSHRLNSEGNSPNNTTTSGSSGGVSVNLVRAGKHLYVKKQHSNNPNGSSGATVEKIPGIISGSPSNRLVFRRSPIFDCRYKSMNDLNRSSLESGASGASKIHYFQHNHHHQLAPSGNSVNSSNYHQLLNGGGGSRGSGTHRHHGLLFRPKSFTSLLMPNFEEVSGGLSKGKSSSRSKLDNAKVVPSHHHAIHSPPPPPLELLHSSRCHRSRHRASLPANSALFL